MKPASAIAACSAEDRYRVRFAALQLDAANASWGTGAPLVHFFMCFVPLNHQMF